MVGVVVSRREFVDAERAALSDTVAQHGPDRPTLCAGWQTRDLLEHLVLRDAGPLRTALVGRAAVTDAVTRADWQDLIERFRSGPPVGSPFRLPGADGAANVEEFFVHHEDVRRAQSGWTPRPLSSDIEDTIWKRLRSPLGRMAVRRADVGIHMSRPDGDHATLRAARPGVIVTGPPSEILLFVFGRTAAAQVELGGPNAAREMLQQTRLGF